MGTEQSMCNYRFAKSEKKCMFVHNCTGYDLIYSGFGNVFTGLVTKEWYNLSRPQCYV